jgi:cysteine desulfurase
MVSSALGSAPSVSAGSFVYLDHAATTPMRPEAVEAMLPYLSEQYANPSGSHRFSRNVRKAVDDARELIAEIIGCRPGEVVFTSGGTEADNTAIFSGEGVPVCPAAEHHAVLHAVESRNGRVVTVDAAGRVDLAALAHTLDDISAGGGRVSVVSVMAVNNEVGTITDLGAVAEVVQRHAPDAALHTDAVQAACWLDLRAITPNVQFMSLSAHKFGGPKGIGALVARSGAPLHPLLIGGGQERERRSGTHNVPGIIAMAAALAATDAERSAERDRIAALRNDLVDRIVHALPDTVETVEREHKVAGSAHLCFPDVENESLLYLLDEAAVCASAASACASGAMEPSHVLAAMGVPTSTARGALRLTLGHTTSQADVDAAVDAVVAAVARLRQPVGSTR